MCQQIIPSFGVEYRRSFCAMAPAIPAWIRFSFRMGHCRHGFQAGATSPGRGSAEYLYVVLSFGLGLEFINSNEIQSLTLLGGNEFAEGAFILDEVQLAVEFCGIHYASFESPDGPPGWKILLRELRSSHPASCNILSRSGVRRCYARKSTFRLKSFAAV